MKRLIFVLPITVIYFSLSLNAPLFAWAKISPKPIAAPKPTTTPKPTPTTTPKPIAAPTTCTDAETDTVIDTVTIKGGAVLSETVLNISIKNGIKNRSITRLLNYCGTLNAPLFPIIQEVTITDCRPPFKTIEKRTIIFRYNLLDPCNPILIEISTYIDIDGDGTVDRVEHSAQ